MALSHFRMLVHELLNEDPDMVPKEASLIVLDSKSAMCMAKNSKDTKHTRHIADNPTIVGYDSNCSHKPRGTSKPTFSSPKGYLPSFMSISKI